MTEKYKVARANLTILCYSHSQFSLSNPVQMNFFVELKSKRWKINENKMNYFVEAPHNNKLLRLVRRPFTKIFGK